ncbi:MAG: type II secretion system protein GspE [Dethiosulfovibrio peptidovorans]|nr:MAG: type II secretion system protein GspE [Dethiosulfovibrio peptidovorans]
MTKEAPQTSQSEGLPSASAIADILPDTVSLDGLRADGILPIRWEHDLLIVAVPSLDRYDRAQALGYALGAVVDVEIFEVSAIVQRLNELYDLKSGMADDAVRDMEGIDDVDALAREDVLSDSVDVPVIRLVNGLFVDAMKQRATDIHVEPYEDSVVVRFRTDGVLRDRLTLPRSHQAPLVSRLKVMARMDIAEHMTPQDGRIGITVGGRAVDIRVNSIPTQHGERIALRLLDKGSGVLTLRELGMDDRELGLMERIISNPYGMILFTGPTGSGKSTSLYAILQELAKPSVNVITVEDPVEYDLPGVAQIQVNEKAGMTFASALRSILRQDPDIVMIGEMRDFDTAHIGVQASLTGHLVLSTLHTNDSISAVARLVDMEVEPYLVAGSLVGVIAQRLVRRLCPYCRRSVDVPSMLRRQGVNHAWGAEGCPQCAGTGYRGRVGIYEQLLMDDGLKEAVARNASAREMRDLAKPQGFRTLWEIGLSLVDQGTTSPEELIRVAGES